MYFDLSEKNSMPIGSFLKRVKSVEMKDPMRAIFQFLWFFIWVLVS